MKRFTVFCGSSSGFDPQFSQAAREMGSLLALKGIGIVYGGASIGLMGAVADGCLDQGGEVIGVLPNFLRSKEIAHHKLTTLYTTETMHERKTKMHELSDGAIALPGGFGTLDEIFESLTWGQLGLHQKPIGFYSINGFYDPLMELLAKMVDTGFLKKENYEMVLISEDIETLLYKMANYSPPQVGKWMSTDKV